MDKAVTAHRHEVFELLLENAAMLLKQSIKRIHSECTIERFAFNLKFLLSPVYGFINLSPKDLACRQKQRNKQMTKNKKPWKFEQKLCSILPAIDIPLCCNVMPFIKHIWNMETQYESSWKKTFFKKNLKYISRKEILGKRVAADSMLTFI